MGDSWPVICLTCKEIKWVKRDLIDDFSVYHRGHDWLIIPPEAIGDFDLFKRTIKLILKWDKEKVEE